MGSAEATEVLYDPSMWETIQQMVAQYRPVLGIVAASAILGIGLRPLYSK